MGRVVRPAAGRRRPAAGRRNTGPAGAARRRGRCAKARQRVNHRLCEHHLGGDGTGVSWGRGSGTALPPAAAVERCGDGAPGAAARCRCGRPHLHLRRRGDPLRGGPEPLLPRRRSSRRRRPDLLPGPRFTGHVCPGLPRGPPDRNRPRRFPAGTFQGAARAALLPAPQVDARLLAVPHRVDGDRPDERPSTRPSSTATCRVEGSGTPRSSGYGRS